MPLCCLPLYMVLPACRTSCTRLSVPRWTKGVEHKEEIVSNPRYIKKKIIEKSFRLLNERFCRISFRWGSVWEVRRSKTNTTEPLNVSDAVIHALLSEWTAWRMQGSVEGCRFHQQIWAHRISSSPAKHLCMCIFPWTEWKLPQSIRTRSL